MIASAQHAGFSAGDLIVLFVIGFLIILASTNTHDPRT